MDHLQLDRVEDGLLRHLGVKVVEATGERCEMRLVLDETHHQPYGIAHGGIYCTLAEATASLGAVLAHGGPAVGMSNHTDFLKPASEGTLVAVATPIHVGRSSQLWEVAITHQESGRRVAQAKVRMFNLSAEG